VLLLLPSPCAWHLQPWHSGPELVTKKPRYRASRPTVARIVGYYLSCLCVATRAWACGTKCGLGDRDVVVASLSLSTPMLKYLVQPVADGSWAASIRYVSSSILHRPSEPDFSSEMSPFFLHAAAAAAAEHPERSLRETKLLPEKLHARLVQGANMFIRSLSELYTAYTMLPASQPPPARSAWW
jgi:hypothetical protein